MYSIEVDIQYNGWGSTTFRRLLKPKLITATFQQPNLRQVEAYRLYSEDVLGEELRNPRLAVPDPATGARRCKILAT